MIMYNSDDSVQRQTGNTKSRHLSVMEYLDVLQKEWWICNLRRKIYPSVADKNFYNRTANKKKTRIQEMCERNQIDNIFTKTDLMKELNRFFMKRGGMPIFDGMTELDILNYYLPETDVRCFYGFDKQQQPIVKLGKVESFDLEKKIITVRFSNNSIENLELTKVSRIL